MDEEFSTSLQKGSRVWCKTDEQTWTAAVLLSITETDAAVELESGQQLTISLKKTAPANPEIQNGIPDLTQLSHLNEPSILFDLQFRYVSDQIYTNAGPVLIAVNPCKDLALYTPEIANLYKGGAREVQAHLPPHIYLVAANAFRAMVREKQGQSLVINGESGAGKTETTKKAMQYFARLAGGTGIEDQVLDTNPILEAFGNAKTLRNHNSSRFGKLIQIHFSATNHICGARIKTYLLEKSRVVHQLKGERSYHIFYQLVRGANQEDRKQYCLPTSPSYFNYLKQSGCMEIENVDDASDLRQVQSALTDIGVDKEEQQQIFSLLSGILWLGNLEFVKNAMDADGNEAVAVRGNEALKIASRQLMVPVEQLAQALTQRRITAGGELIVRLLTLDEARDARDALSKAIYAGIFSWIVDRINKKLDTTKNSSGQFIAILDIYGFEQFQRNSFEQLCINYANERLQQQFVKHLFTLEQAEYMSEGIDWTKVEFVDNQDCVDAIEVQPPKGLGLISVLDSQCKFPKATDTTFVQSLKDTLANHGRFTFHPRTPTDFVIKHYAGSVQYDSTGFLEKNKDMLSPDLKELMAASGQPLLADLGCSMAEEVDPKRSASTQTVGSRFSQELRDLIAMLDTTGLHFVRCIKPNGALQPGKFENQLALHQLRCCGVLEVARVARAGYPTRYLHSQFVERYAVMLPAGRQLDTTSPQALVQACQQLLDEFRVDPEGYQIGHTKIFFRPGVLAYVEDVWARKQDAALRVQTFWRMRAYRRKFQRQRSAAVMVQSAWRCVVASRQLQQLQREHAAAVHIQAFVRGRQQAARYQRTRRAAVSIQMGVRRWRFQQRVGVRVQARLAREAEEARLAEELRQKEMSWTAVHSKYGLELEQVQHALELYAARMAAPPGESYKHSHAPAAKAGAAMHRLVSHLSGGAASDCSSPLASASSLQEPTPEAVRKLEVENAKLRKHLAAEKALREKYAEKLEEQALDWVDQVRVLQEYIQTVRSAIGEQLSNSSSPNGGSPAPSGLAAAGVSMTDSAPNSTKLPNGSVAGSVAEELMAAEQQVVQLQADMARQTYAMDQAATLMREAAYGTAEVPGMDPVLEFYRLKETYSMWKREYREKLRVTADVIKKIEALNGHRSSGSPAGAAAAAAAVRSVHSGWSASHQPGGSGSCGSPPLGDGGDLAEASYAVKKAHFKSLLASSMKERSS